MNTGLLSYSKNTDNLGDYVQSIATANLIGSYDVLLEREKLNMYQGDPVKIVLNGWFMTEPDNWPPSPDVHPLFISMHINPTAKAKMLDQHGVQYLKKHAPIGCRDYYTMSLLHEHGIPAYFSACNTLTLKRSQLLPDGANRKGVLVCGVLDRIITARNLGLRNFKKKPEEAATALLKFPVQYAHYFKARKKLNEFLSRLSGQVSYIDQIVDLKNLSEQQRLDKAASFLRTLAKAELVITSRIHTALPAIALETPVIFLEDGLEHINQYSRLIGLNRFFTTVRASDLNTIDIETLENPKQHHKFVSFLEKKVKNFIDKKT